MLFAALKQTGTDECRLEDWNTFKMVDCCFVQVSWRAKKWIRRGLQHTKLEPRGTPQRAGT